MIVPRVALTYDDGPSEWTEPLLDVLAKHDARATFFVLGSQIEGREQTIVRAAEQGHELAIHGWDHTPCDALTPGALLAQVEVTASLIEDITGTEPRWWRPPWNKTTEPVAALLEEKGYGYCGCTIDGLDTNRSEARIVRKVMAELRTGAIIGLHDGVANNGNQEMPNRAGTVRATARILKGCRSVTVSDLLAVPA